ncbi:hypothetical protein Tco_1456683 [Tanacetum coccineum]
MLSLSLQPIMTILSWLHLRVILSSSKTTGYDKPRHPVLQILWGIIHRSNIDYAKRIWEEFVQSIQTFLTDRKNLATALCGKKKTALLLILNVRFTKLIIHHLRTKHNIHPRTERGKVEEGRATESSKATKVTKPKAAKVTKPAGDPDPKKRKLVKETPDDPLPAKRSKAGLVGKMRKAKSPLRLIDEPSDEGVPVEEPAHDDEEADLQRALELKVQGKRKEKVVKEQAAHDLLTLHTPKKKSLAEQFIFQRRTPMPTEPSRQADSPSLDAELPLTDSETESDEEVHSEEQAPVIKAGHQDEGQARPNPGEKDEGQASNPGDAVESQPQPSHVVHVGPNLEHMDLETTDASTQQKPEQMDEEFTTTTYPNKSQEEEPRKTNAEAEVQSIVLVPIHQDTSSVPPMTTLVIDLTKDLPTVEMKEILQQRMFEDNTYKTHEVHNYLYKALQKLVELDYSNQCLADQEEVRKKKRKRRESPRTPPGSPPIQPPSPPPPSGASADIPGAQELSPTNYLMQDDSIPEEQVHLSDDEDSENDHQPKADSRKDWWKPLPEEEGPATLEPAWAIPSSNKSFLESAFGW